MLSMNSINSYSKMLKKNSHVSKLINLEILERNYLNTYSEISIDLVRSLSYRTKLSGFLLLKTLLRFGDLYNINLSSALSLQRISLIQSKTGKPININFKIELSALAFELVTINDIEPFLNYQMLSNDISKYLRKKNILQEVSWKKNCHIFRHLESTFMFSKDIPAAFIAKLLGDDEKTVKNSYIHKDLLNNFF